MTAEKPAKSKDDKQPRQHNYLRRRKRPAPENKKLGPAPENKERS